MLDPSEGLAFFTDGSAYTADRSGGWAWVGLDAFDGISKDSGYVFDTTISQMELLAATMALEDAAGAFGPCEVMIFSDSEYVVLGCNDRSRKRNKNKQYWRRIDAAIESHQYVEFHHVKGHADNLFNEMADQLAGDARRYGAKGVK